MLKSMPENHPLSCQQPVSTDTESTNSNSNSGLKQRQRALADLVLSEEELDEGEVFAGTAEDPNDPEWNGSGSVEKIHHR